VAEPPLQFDRSLFNPTLMWTEHLNRLLGVTVGFVILAAVVSALRIIAASRGFSGPRLPQCC